MGTNTHTFVLTRPEDLVVLGVQAENFQLGRDAANGAAIRMVAMTNARLRLIFPPQAMLELGFTGGPLPLPSRLSTSSVVEFQIDAETAIPLKAEGILAALSEATIVPTADVLNAPHTLLDAPWGLLWTPRGSTDDTPVRSRHASAPMLSPAGAAGLWCSELTAHDGLRLLPLAALLDDQALAGQTPLSAESRKQIVDEAARAPTKPQADVALSALGATLKAQLQTERFCWMHSLSLGRDERVRVLSRGMLYPFGHRSTLIETTERRIDTAADPVAGLHIERHIVVTEPVRLVERKDFPFSAVEILEEAISFDVHGDPHLRELPDLATPLSDQRAALASEKDNLDGVLRARLAETVPSDIFDMAARGIPDAPQLMELQGSIAALGDEIAAIDGQIAAIANQMDELQRQLDQLGPCFIGPDGESDPGCEARAQELSNAIRELQGQMPSVPGLPAMRQQLAQMVSEAGTLAIQVQAQFNAIPRTFEALRDSGDAEAARFFEITPVLESLDLQIAEILGEVAQNREVFFQPQNAAGRPVKFSFKFTAPGAATYASLPLIFVHDFEATGSAHFSDFLSLSDAGTIEKLSQAWVRQGNGAVALPGTTLDLVCDPIPQKGDIYEVHGFDIAAAAGFAGAYLPRLSKIDVKLPSLRMLLPGQDALVSLAYSTAANAGMAPLTPLLPIVVDFTGNAIRSGGLVSPKFEADALSREFGPVSSAALGAVADMASIYKDATLLGFKLGDLINPAGGGQLPGDPKNAPKIVPLYESGRLIGTTLAWKFPLQSKGMFVAGPNSRLDLEVTCSNNGMTTHCALHDFALSLPEGNELVRLGFGSLSLEQKDNSPPKVTVTGGLTLSFAGALKLLDDLQRQLQGLLGLDGLMVRTTEKGIRASYELVLPDASSGVFVMRNIAFSMAVDVPFTADPVTVTLGFARADNPFTLSVMTFGGGGYIAIQLSRGSVTRLELSLEFGGFAAVNFLVASGEIHAAGGVRLILEQGRITLQAYIRVGGSLEVLGLVAVSVELLLTLTYKEGPQQNRLSGRATLVIEIDVLFLSKSVEIDSGEWVFSGPGDTEQQRIAAPAEDFQRGLEDWTAYQEAFAV